MDKYKKNIITYLGLVLIEIIFFKYLPGLFFYVHGTLFMLIGNDLYKYLINKTKGKYKFLLFILICIVLVYLFFDSFMYLASI